jgi:hypothetical protein
VSEETMDMIRVYPFYFPEDVPLTEDEVAPKGHYICIPTDDWVRFLEGLQSAGVIFGKGDPLADLPPRLTEEKDA